MREVPRELLYIGRVALDVSRLCRRIAILSRDDLREFVDIPIIRRHSGTHAVLTDDITLITLSLRGGRESISG